MTELSPRLAVPPRDLAATITANSVLRAGWTVAGVYLALGLVAFVSLWVQRGFGLLALVPLAGLLECAGALLVLSRKPNLWRGLLFLAIGTASTYFWVSGLLRLDPTLNAAGIFLINRMTVVLILVGAVSSRLIHGLYWCTAGWVLGSTATAIAQWNAGLDILRGFGPPLTLAIYLLIIVMFVQIKRSQLQFNSAFSDQHLEPARIAGARQLEERAVALLHDTVLNDLAVIAQAKGQLDDRTRARFAADIRAVAEAKVEPEIIAKDAGGWLRREFLSIVNEFQWRGLRVEITGDAPVRRKASPQAAEAIAGAARSCLENIVRHSSSKSAELFVDYSQTDLSVMIVDHGIGFEMHAVPPDRLGIRQSIVQRVESVGGSVKIWSTIGVGTSILITVPLWADDELWAPGEMSADDVLPANDE